MCSHPAASLTSVSALLVNSRNGLSPRTRSCFNIYEKQDKDPSDFSSLCWRARGEAARPQRKQHNGCHLQTAACAALPARCASSISGPGGTRAGEPTQQRRGALLVGGCPPRAGGLSCLGVLPTPFPARLCALPLLPFLPPDPAAVPGGIRKGTRFFPLAI